MLYSFSLICVDMSQQASACRSNRCLCMNHHATWACVTQLNNILLINRKMNIDDSTSALAEISLQIFNLGDMHENSRYPTFMCVCDEINQLPRNMFPLNVIVNIHMSKERGVHWSALYINKDKVFFF